MRSEEHTAASLSPGALSPVGGAAGSLDDARWIELPSHRDDRGVLTAIEGGIDVPFEIERVYFLHDLRGARGGHAHRDTRQIVVGLSGRSEIQLSDGRRTRRFVLDDPTRGLLVVPMLFIRLGSFSPDATVAVLASTHYDKRRSIWSWEEYLEAVGC